MLPETRVDDLTAPVTFPPMTNPDGFGTALGDGAGFGVTEGEAEGLGDAVGLGVASGEADGLGEAEGLGDT